MAKQPKCASLKKYIIEMFYIFIMFINNANNANYANYLLKESQFQLRFLAHHVFAPFWLEHDGYIDIFDALYAPYFLPDVLHNEITGRARWSR
jgi:hypothetical protein